MSFEQIHELFEQGMLWMCIALAVVCALAEMVLLLRRIVASPAFRRLRLRRGGGGLVLFAIAMLFNSYPTNADKNRAGGSATPGCLFAREPVPRLGADGGVNGSFSVDAVTVLDGVPGFPAWTNTIDAICITGVAVGQSSVWIRVSWPFNDLLPSSLLDVFSARECNANAWTFCGSVSVPAATNEVVVAAFIQDSPISVFGRQFFRIGTKADSDGDGLSDAFERLVSQTDPLSSDSDGDGLPDGWEHENGLEPNLWSDAYSDPDGDGIPNLYEYHNGTLPQVSDAERIERIVAGGIATNAVATLSAALAVSSPYSVIEVADGVHEGPGWSGFSITLPDYPVLITSSDCGRSRRAVIRHAGQMAAMYLNATQTTHTVVQGICYDLVATNGAQMAFWCGGNLPWSGPPAGGMFRDIYVRMPNPGVEYEGWFFRHYESNEVVIASCTVNAYGATNARGIYAVDSPPMSVENCTFVNFPSNEGGLGYGIQYESTVQNWGGAPGSIPLEIVNCLFDASFTNAYALAPLENGVAYDVSMINCIVPSPLEYEADFTDGLIVTNAGVSFSGHIPDGSPACGAGVESLYAPVDIDGQDRTAAPDIGADQFVPGVVALDTDGDGLSDADEDWMYGSDPFLVDSDWDGSPDGAEVANGTDPLDRLSLIVDVTLTVTNTFASAGVTNYFGFSNSATGWDVTNVYATTCWGQASNGVAATAGLYGKAFSDLNRNGVYDEDADVIRIVSLESEYAVVNAVISLGDIDGDRVPDATERNEGTDPYDENNFYMSVIVRIQDEDAGHGITNYVSYALSQLAVVPVVTNAFSVATYTNVVSGVVTEGRIYVRGFRDLNGNGTFDDGVDGVFSLDLAKVNNGGQESLTIGDSDRDNILDSEEISEGTSPLNRLSYCFNCVLQIYNIFATTNNLKAEAFLGANCIIGPTIQTNASLSLDLGHLVTTNGDSVVIYFWDDKDGDGERGPEEPYTTITATAQSHDTAHSYSLPLGGFDANGDLLPDWWQSYYNLGDSAYEDPDGDGLVNLHEWWAGTDPLVPDGSNTVLSVCCRSVDKRIEGKVPSSALRKFSTYTPGNWVRNADFWANDVDTSCASFWNSSYGRFRAGTLLTKRHMLFASHFPPAIGSSVLFLGTDNNIYTNTIVATSTVDGTDILIGLLQSEMPDVVSPARLLPDGYEEYICIGTRIPVCQFDFDEQGLVYELEKPLASYATTRTPLKTSRVGFYENTVVGDSGDPIYLLIDGSAILLGVLHVGNVKVQPGRYEGGGAPFTTYYAREIQNEMDKLLPGYSLQFYDFSQYQKLPMWKGNEE